ncbi:aminomethyl-transferring glycine dehydrogenase subunit GcvPA [Truepera radiovictrix]|uniref:Probable glycine dehydrogenase (decarboxylating) subunit 1 n=1 Tax=Truepera radiovictrix (strain DSM 17093 / CIP 108686 / LMG 22925 / RQ-24) TaxID=649638 RepID=D7CVH8_TRURR|nr:aminomethyl-transferring glycine dehydrogenase subunit GcvPA [Truepera radiovictrix]ADI14206.1 Glycine dehydrogenase (decarboxylating) [Truepera radiovictrix DSM 17093]WMT57236.1 aminomethyl-transferring glycine dehydrogenase subunit GcvPA [Truepera radiovictrix]
MNYLPHTPEDVARALAAIGVESVDALFGDLPEALQVGELRLPEGLDEAALLRHLRALAAKNKPVRASFLGGGLKGHFIPAVTPHLALQSEFVTAYTPYQPEVSQGILQATFEFQTMMSELTGLPISNASMYDGATAVAEAALLAVRHKGRHRVLVSQGVHPETREVLATYLRPLEVALEEVALRDLTTPEPAVGEDVACVVAQNPNFLGYLEPMPALAEAAHAAGALFVAVCDPFSLAVLKSPGEYGADVAVGDGQTVGNPVAFGGPHFGFMVVTEPLLRQLPGRLVGETTDLEGRRAFVLTLQAREQHIRRSKAKSNICSNHQLSALMAAVNLSALGPQGLREAATKSVQNAHLLARRLAEAGLAPLTHKPFFNEFAVRLPVSARALRRALAEHGVAAAVPVPASYGLGDAALFAATELTTPEDIDLLVAALGRVLAPPPTERANLVEASV